MGGGRASLKSLQELSGQYVYSHGAKDSLFSGLKQSSMKI